MKRKTGDIVKNTEAFGDVEIRDVYSSDKTPDHFVYEVEDIAGQKFLCYERDLNERT